MALPDNSQRTPLSTRGLDYHSRLGMQSDRSLVTTATARTTSSVFADSCSPNGLRDRSVGDGVPGLTACGASWRIGWSFTPHSELRFAVTAIESTRSSSLVRVMIMLRLAASDSCFGSTTKEPRVPASRCVGAPIEIVFGTENRGIIWVAHRITMRHVRKALFIRLMTYNDWNRIATIIA